NLSIAAGKTTALVGLSGSGKSTIPKLIMRFYDPIYGRITLDGNPTKALNIGWLRQNIAIVQQEPDLFNATIFRNVAFGRPDFADVTMDEVIEACKVAQIHDFISGGLTYGYQTVVGGINSVELSGGQKQRIAIARAVLRNAPILILGKPLIF